MRNYFLYSFFAPVQLPQSNLYHFFVRYWLHFLAKTLHNLLAQTSLAFRFHLQWQKPQLHLDLLPILSFQLCYPQLPSGCPWACACFRCTCRCRLQFRDCLGILDRRSCCLYCWLGFKKGETLVGEDWMQWARRRCRRYFTWVRCVCLEEVRL